MKILITKYPWPNSRASSEEQSAWIGLLLPVIGRFASGELSFVSSGGFIISASECTAHIEKQRPALAVQWNSLSGMGSIAKTATNYSSKPVCMFIPDDCCEIIEGEA